jgi:hypothetical protein
VSHYFSNENTAFSGCSCNRIRLDFFLLRISTHQQKQHRVIDQSLNVLLPFENFLFSSEKLSDPPSPDLCHESHESYESHESHESHESDESHESRKLNE